MMVERWRLSGLEKKEQQPMDYSIDALFCFLNENLNKRSIELEEQNGGCFGFTIRE